MYNNIIRCVVEDPSDNDSLRRVTVKNPAIWEDKSDLCDSVNGLFLRKGEIVYVDISDGIHNPLVLGRVGNWIDGQEILDLFNNLVKEINNTRDKLNELIRLYNAHMHTYPAVPIKPDSVLKKEIEKYDDRSIDEIFHVD